MTDPDAPSPSDPYLREHLHWFVLLTLTKCDSYICLFISLIMAHFEGGGGNVSNMSFLEKKFQDGH